MPVAINIVNNDIIGSVIYEEYGADEMQLEFFTSTLNPVKKDTKFDLP
jgi:hypothetical protein